MELEDTILIEINQKGQNDLYNLSDITKNSKGITQMTNQNWSIERAHNGMRLRGGEMSYEEAGTEGLSVDNGGEKWTY